MSAEDQAQTPVTIQKQSAHLLDDLKRVRVSLTFKDATLQTTVNLSLHTGDDAVISSASILGVLNNRVDFTLHTGKQPIGDLLVLKVQVLDGNGDLMLESSTPVAVPGR